ncbi:MAG TPA: nickel pincer cofactor biosynthesis protein LarC [Gemmatimonadaceae bacterium]|nr:nickel pincer cofactor biosynthesis protein LarC [Gemmatimonadaceae bacterium]
MPIAILDPFSGIAGDMTLGALVDVGLDADWLRALPGRLGIDGVEVRIDRVKRAGLACTKVDFEIPPQPHSRGIREIRKLIADANVPDAVRSRADAAFTILAQAEGAIHGVPPEDVHLHEVGAVDAILDITGSVWGFELLDVRRVYCGALTVGEGTVSAAHGVLPVPAPATMKLLEGLEVRPGPEGSGELVTPTGAALVRTLSSGRPPASYTPLRSGFGAGTKNPRGRANALRIILAEESMRDGLEVDHLVQLATDVDDMDGEEIAAAADTLRELGALDVVLTQTIMKKGRPATRIEVLCRPAVADELERALFVHSTTIGVRRARVERTALPREERTIRVLDHDVRVKLVTLPSGALRAKPGHDDLSVIAAATGRALRDVAAIARAEAERLLGR